MGRKGVSKRKTSKSKDSSAASKGSNGSVASLANVSASPAAQSVGKGEVVSSGKNSKKK